MAHSVIDNSSGLFVAGGGLFFMILSLLSVGGFIEHPLPHLFKLMLKWVFIGAFALNADTYFGWVVEAIRGLEVGLADAFSPNGKGVAAKSVYQVIDRTMTDGFDIASDLIARAGRCGMTEIGMILYDWLIAGTMIIATFLITLPAGAMIITAKVLLAFAGVRIPVHRTAAVWADDQQVVRSMVRPGDDLCHSVCCSHVSADAWDEILFGNVGRCAAHCWKRPSDRHVGDPRVERDRVLHGLSGLLFRRPACRWFVVQCDHIAADGSGGVESSQGGLQHS